MIGTNQLQTAELSKVEGGGGFRRRVCGIGVWALAVWCGLLSVRSEAVAVPNGSFEEPQSDFAGPTVAAWQKSAEPAWYQGGGGFPWDQLVGQFLNTTNGSPNHIDNMDGNQAAFLFALPEVAIYQDYNSVGGTDSEPTHRFDATFEPGKWYSLTVGVLGGGGGMKEGATLQLTLYYRDAGGNPVTVASRTVTNSPSLFPTNTHFIDFQLRTPQIQVSDPWAGRNIGIRIASTVGFELQGGYWDLDAVRLTENLVPNGSFESPETDFAGPTIAEWQKAPEPIWYQGGGGFPWEQLVGQFLNTTNGSPNHIDNVDGEQAAFLFALPDVAIFQDYNTVGGTDGEPGHRFDVKFEAGKTYSLTAGVLGGGGGMKEGVTLQLTLYYRDAEGNPVTVASRTVTNSPALFPTYTHFTDFVVRTDVVKATDPWVGRNLGIRIASTVGFELQGGYWDLDQVRLSVEPAPVVSGLVVADGHFRFTIEGAPGDYAVLASDGLNAVGSAWTVVGTISNRTGSVVFTDPGVVVGSRFYRVERK